MMAAEIDKPVELARQESMAPLISVVGSDGAGKTTVSSEVLDFVRSYGPAETAHLGLKSGDIGRAIKELPLVGAFAEGYLSRKASQARNRKGRIPGPFTAIVIYVFSLFRLGRFKRMLGRRRDGVIIVTDRYPQVEVPGFYDGPGLSAAKAEGRIVTWLARREYKKYLWMASHQPDLVIRLNVDLDTAFARKPDHEIDMLRQKIEATPKLSFGGALIHDIDSNLPLDAVVASARKAIADRMKQLGRQPRPA
jgi:thymidylate kinase